MQITLVRLLTLVVTARGFISSAPPRLHSARSTSLLSVAWSKKINGVKKSAAPAQPLPTIAVLQENIRGPITADGIARPNVEKGYRYTRNEWLNNLVSLPSSYVLHRIRNHLTFNTIIAVLITILYKKTQIPCSVSTLGHTLTGGFLSLLLVFRQNSAYSRFYEARGLWSECTACCRSMAIDTVTHVRPHAPVAAEKFLQLIAAFPSALAYSCLSGQYPLAHNVKKLVIPRSKDSKLQPAVILCFMMQECLHDTALEWEEDSSRSNMIRPIDTLYLNGLSQYVQQLSACLTSCEKIVKTPVPWSYSRHTSRILSVWSGTLPLALVSLMGWLTIPGAAAVCWCLFGIEEIGHLMEQPFFGYNKSLRARMTQPYDIGLPVFVLSNQARLEVEGIATVQRGVLDG